MTLTPPRLAPVDLLDGAQRLSADDMATAREAQFLASALAMQCRAGAQRQATPGTCANCSEACLPLAVYCDAECRADDEQRQRVLQRQGRLR